MEKYRVTVNGVPYEVEIESLGAAGSVPVAAPAVNAAPAAPVTSQPAAAPAPAQPAAAPASGGEGVLAPMQGKIVSVEVSAGQMIKAGQVIAILEAMKMENEIMASRDAKVADVHVAAGQSVEANDVLVTLE